MTEVSKLAEVRLQTLLSSDRAERVADAVRLLATMGPTVALLDRSAAVTADDETKVTAALADVLRAKTLSATATDPSGQGRNGAVALSSLTASGEAAFKTALALTSWSPQMKPAESSTSPAVLSTYARVPSTMVPCVEGWLAERIALLTCAGPIGGTIGPGGLSPLLATVAPTCGIASEGLSKLLEGQYSSLLKTQPQGVASAASSLLTLFRILLTLRHTVFATAAGGCDAAINAASMIIAPIVDFAAGYSQASEVPPQGSTIVPPSLLPSMTAAAAGDERLPWCCSAATGERLPKGSLNFPQAVAYICDSVISPYVVGDSPISLGLGTTAAIVSRLCQRSVTACRVIQRWILSVFVVAAKRPTDSFSDLCGEKQTPVGAAVAMRATELAAAVVSQFGYQMPWALLNTLATARGAADRPARYESLVDLLAACSMCTFGERLCATVTSSIAALCPPDPQRLARDWGTRAVDDPRAVWAAPPQYESAVRGFRETLSSIGSTTWDTTQPRPAGLQATAVGSFLLRHRQSTLHVRDAPTQVGHGYVPPAARLTTSLRVVRQDVRLAAHCYFVATPAVPSVQTTVGTVLAEAIPRYNSLDLDARQAAEMEWVRTAHELLRSAPPLSSSTGTLGTSAHAVLANSLAEALQVLARTGAVRAAVVGRFYSGYLGVDSASEDDEEDRSDEDALAAADQQQQSDEESSGFVATMCYTHLVRAPLIACFRWACVRLVSARLRLQAAIHASSSGDGDDEAAVAVDHRRAVREADLRVTLCEADAAELYVQLAHALCRGATQHAGLLTAGASTSLPPIPSAAAAERVTRTFAVLQRLVQHARDAALFTSITASSPIVGKLSPDGALGDGAAFRCAVRVHRALQTLGARLETTPPAAPSISPPLVESWVEALNAAGCPVAPVVLSGATASTYVVGPISPGMAISQAEDETVHSATIALARTAEHSLQNTLSE